MTPSAEAAWRHAQAAQYTVRALDNPNPVYVACIIVSMFLVAWIVYKFAYRMRIRGVWIDNNGKKHMIQHGLFGGITIDGTIKGYMCGTSLITNIGMAVLADDRLVWTGCDCTWKRVTTITKA